MLLKASLSVLVVVVVGGVVAVEVGVDVRQDVKEWPRVCFCLATSLDSQGTRPSQRAPSADHRSSGIYLE